MQPAVSPPRTLPIALTPDDIELIRDIYLPDREDGAEDGFCYLGKAARVRLAGTQIAPWFGLLLQKIRTAHPDAIDFHVTAPTGETFRAHRIHARRGAMIALRRLPSKSPALTDLVLPPCWRDLLLAPNLQAGGLILMAAETGQGKSTTVAGLIRSRLELYGGFAMTIEDPIELPLDGAWGDGECLQTEIAADKPPEVGYAEALRGAFRSYPALSSGGSILLIGEARDSDIAAEAIRAAVGGHLVITTVHSTDITTALSRLAAMAARRMGDETARDMLASALRLVVHQTLTLRENGATGWQRGVIGGELIWSGANFSATANSIRSGNFTSLNQTISQQQAVMGRTNRPTLPQLLKDLA